MVITFKAQTGRFLDESPFSKTLTEEPKVGELEYQL